MDTALNPQQEPHSPMQPAEKSELMQIFENQVNDIYWAYKDLLRAIFESGAGEEHKAQA
jgi:hypothetical protein